MIPMKMIKEENDQWMGRTNEAPTAHSLSSRVVTETGNFGLADAYREKFPEGPTEETVKIKQEQRSWAWSVAGRGRGRGRPPMEWDMSGEQRAAVTPLFPWEMDFKSETDRSTLDHAASSSDEAKGCPETEKKVFGLHDDAPMPTTGPLPKPRLDTRPEITGIYFSPRDDHLKTMFHAFDNKEESASAGSSKAKPKGKNKTNGFILFIKDRARKDGVNGSLNELMEKYNVDWQGLPAEKKEVWKAKAKGSKPPAKAPEGLRMSPMTSKEPVASTLNVKVEPGFNPDKPILPQTRSNSSTSTSKSHGYEEGGEAKKIKQEVEDDWY